MAFITRTSTPNYTERTLTAGSSAVTIVDGDGVAGNPVIDIDPSNIDVNSLNGPLSIVNGGTGQTTQQSAFDALSPLTTKGDILAHNGTNSVRRAVGTDGQILTADSSQASGVTWSNAPATSISYAKLTYTVAYNGSQVGLTTSQTAWNTTPVNTEAVDPDGIVSLSSNEFTLVAGKYLISAEILWSPNASTPPNPDNLMFRLYNSTDSTAASNARHSIAASSGIVSSSTYIVAAGHVDTFVTITGSKAFRIEHIISGNTGSYLLGSPTFSSNSAIGNKDFLTIIITKIG